MNLLDRLKTAHEHLQYQRLKPNTQPQIPEIDPLPIGFAMQIHIQQHQEETFFLFSWVQKEEAIIESITKRSSLQPMDKPSLVRLLQWCTHHDIDFYLHPDAHTTNAWNYMISKTYPIIIPLRRIRTRVYIYIYICHVIPTVHIHAYQNNPNCNALSIQTNRNYEPSACNQSNHRQQDLPYIDQRLRLSDCGPHAHIVAFHFMQEARHGKMQDKERGWAVANAGGDATALSGNLLLLGLKKTVTLVPNRQNAFTVYPKQRQKYGSCFSP